MLVIAGGILLAFFVLAILRNLGSILFVLAVFALIGWIVS